MGHTHIRVNLESRGIGLFVDNPKVLCSDLIMNGLGLSKRTKSA